MIELEPLVSIVTLSEKLGVNKYTLYHKIRAGKFPSGVKLNGRRLFKKSELEDYFNSLNIKNEINL